MNDTIYTISELSHQAKHLLERSFGTIWVEGEISNLSRPSSGHYYFSLKDDQSQVRCVLFRNQVGQKARILSDGTQVIARARVSLYAARTTFQLIIEKIDSVGNGALQKAFFDRKEKLHRAGLFDPARKKPLPACPRCIGVITSPTGAAIQDVLTVLKRRAPFIPIIIYPSLVQGNDAADTLVAALEQANQRQECDVLMLTRGGGSLEDLWPFNEERVAHAIAASTLPIISAVGHEVDFTISDLVADYRAPTPSAGAESVSPDQSEWNIQLQQQQQRLFAWIQHHLQQQYAHLNHITKRLRHPRTHLQEHTQRLDDYEQRLLRSIQHTLRAGAQQYALLQSRRQQQTPTHTLKQKHAQLPPIVQRLHSAVTQSRQQYQQALKVRQHTLNATNPLRVLDRGYALLTVHQPSRIVSDAHQVHPNDRITAQLRHGRLTCTVLETHSNEEKKKIEK